MVLNTLLFRITSKRLGVYLWVQGAAKVGERYLLRTRA